MAGDWIKIRVGIDADPRVIKMTDRLAGERGYMNWLTDPVRQSCKDSAYEHVTLCVLRSVTVLGLIRVWGVANLEGKPHGSNDILMPHATLESIDAIAAVPSFGEAMQAVGWAKEVSKGVVLPGFMKNNIPTEDRQRSQNAERQQRWRDSQKRNVMPPLRSNAKRNAREDKIREENNTHTLSTVRNVTGTEEPLRSRVAECVCALFFAGQEPKTESTRQRFSFIVGEFQGLTDDPAEIRRRAEFLKDQWRNGRGRVTPEALLKHWAQAVPVRGSYPGLPADASINKSG